MSDDAPAAAGTGEGGTTKIVGRTVERGAIRKFILDHVKNRQGGTLYVAGAPGTGKSASVTWVLEDLERTDFESTSKDDGDKDRDGREHSTSSSSSPQPQSQRRRSPRSPQRLDCDPSSSSSSPNSDRKRSRRASASVMVRSFYFNANSCGKQFLSRLAEHLLGASVVRGSSSSYSASSAEEALRARFISEAHETRHSMYVLAVDEVDQLPKGVLASLVGWSNVANSPLVLVGIANVVDARRQIPPTGPSTFSSSSSSVTTAQYEELAFAPYKAIDLKAIVRTQIDMSLFTQEAAEKGLELYARKTEATSGDARALLDICGRAIELANSRRTGALVEFSDLAQAFKAGFAAKALAFSSTSNLVGGVSPDQLFERIDALPTQAKLAFVACYAAIAAVDNTTATAKVSVSRDELSRRDSCPRPLVVDFKKCKGTYLDLDRLWHLPVEGEFEDHLELLKNGGMIVGHHSSNSSSGGSSSIKKRGGPLPNGGANSTTVELRFSREDVVAAAAASARHHGGDNNDHENTGGDGWKQLLLILRGAPPPRVALLPNMYKADL